MKRLIVFIAAIFLISSAAPALAKKVVSFGKKYKEVTQAEAEAGTDTKFQIWSAERVKQAIIALAPASSFDPASPGAIGGTTPAAGTFTTLTGSTVNIGTVNHSSGTGSPENVVDGGYGDEYRDTSNGDIYNKTTASGNTGWIKASLSWTVDPSSVLCIDSNGNVAACENLTDSTIASGITVSTATPTNPGEAYLNDTTHVLTIASSTGLTAFTGSFTAWDTTPDAFSFTDQTDVDLSTAITSEAITVAGINKPVAISVSGGTYDINASGLFTSSLGTVSVGNTVRARHTSSDTGSTAVDTVVTIGGVSDTFTSTTASSILTDSCTGGLLFSWHSENVDVTLGGSAGVVSNGCSVGDTTATANSAVALATDQYQDGAKSVGWSTADDYYIFAANEDIIKKAAGTIIFYVRITTFANGGGLFAYGVDTTNRIQFKMYGTDDATGREAILTYTGNNTSISAITSTGNMALNTWYRVTGKWSIADVSEGGTRHLSLQIDATTKAYQNSALTELVGTPSYVRVGDFLGSGGAVNIDNIKIYDSWTND